MCAITNPFALPARGLRLTPHKSWKRHHSASAARSHSSQASSRSPVSFVHSKGTSSRFGPIGTSVENGEGRRRARTVCPHEVAFKVRLTGQCGVVDDSSTTHLLHQMSGRDHEVVETRPSSAGARPVAVASTLPPTKSTHPACARSTNSMFQSPITIQDPSKPLSPEAVREVWTS